MPTKVPHAYNALDWYFVTDIWCEKIRNGHKFWKMRLEVTDPSSPVWWAPADLPEVPKPQPGDFTADSQECEACQMSSKRIFSNTWACLNYNCPRCFDIGEGVEFHELRYSQEFLDERRRYTGKITGTPDTRVEFPSALAPPIPMVAEGDTGTEERMRQGFVCPHCLGCSPRSHWAGWFCGTPGCGFKQECTMKPIPITEIDSTSTRKKLASRKVEQHSSMVDMASSFQRGGYEVIVYPLLNLIDGCKTPRVVGVLARLRPSAEMRAAPNGPDDSFRDFHEHAAKDDWMRLPVRLKGGECIHLRGRQSQGLGANTGRRQTADADEPLCPELRSPLQVCRFRGL